KSRGSGGPARMRWLGKIVIPLPASPDSLGNTACHSIFRENYRATLPSPGRKQTALAYPRFNSPIHPASRRYLSY
ncbi:hypothetical protein, partial [Burkholderia gladioli]|uniref:hypothetical protein n=1 Tax=Burkholderia gladioli TaxID=28095 RepID=UPI001C2688C7